MDLLEQARERSWYHAIDLGDGTVTPGWFDLRPFVNHYGIPDDLNGMRALEIGTWDGFWAFEMERRGAARWSRSTSTTSATSTGRRDAGHAFSTEMRGDGFRLAEEILQSSVERVN